MDGIGRLLEEIDRLAGELARSRERQLVRRGVVRGWDLAAVPKIVRVEVGASSTTVDMRFLASYAPTAGDEVLVLWPEGDPVVIDKFA